MRARPTHKGLGVLLLGFLAVASPAARGDELPSPANLDGWYVTLGPVAGAAHVEGQWISVIGGEVSVLHLAEAKFPAVLGIAGGGVSYGSLPGGRLWLEAEAALKGPLPFALGLALGATAQIERVDPPRLGIEATLWGGAGVVPYVRVGKLDIAGNYLEVGVMLKVPVRFAY